MKFVKKIKTYLQSKILKSKHDEPSLLSMRLNRLERNYVVLLKRVLELDGVQLKINAFSSKILQTNSDESIKPTIH
mgnify:FL=1